MNKLVLSHLVVAIFLVVASNAHADAASDATGKELDWCKKNLWSDVSIPNPYVHQTALGRGPADLSDQMLAASYVDKNGYSVDSPAFSLTLSGGGFRAMLFHVGALHRLNDARLLPKLLVVSSVSGGSITAAVLASRWHELKFDLSGRATNLTDIVEKPLFDLAGKTIDTPSVVAGLLPFTSAPDRFVSALERDLASLKDVPLSSIAPGRVTEVEAASRPRPLFIFNATSLQTGELVEFRGRAFGGPKIGWTSAKGIKLSEAVAASAGFPPFFAPIKLRLDRKEQDWYVCTVNRDEPHGISLAQEPNRSIPTSELPYYRQATWLADGGIRDNLGLSAIEYINRVREDQFQPPSNFDPRRCPRPSTESTPAPLPSERCAYTVNLISDGGLATGLDLSPWTNWYSVFRRVADVMSDEPNDLRVANLIRPNSKDVFGSVPRRQYENHVCESETVDKSEGMFREADAARSGDKYAYWSVRRMPKLHRELGCPSPKSNAADWMRAEVKELSALPTALSFISEEMRYRLINWGYLATHHGLPYISRLVVPKQVSSFIASCKVPHPPARFDPLKSTPSAWDAICLPGASSPATSSASNP